MCRLLFNDAGPWHVCWQSLYFLASFAGVLSKVCLALFCLIKNGDSSSLVDFYRANAFQFCFFSYLCTRFMKL